MQTPDYTLIATADALAAALERWRETPWLAVDTEFVREDTYFAELCLVQLGDGTTQACVDALAVDLAPLWAFLQQARPLKVLHCVSFRQDFDKPTFVVDISDEFETKLAAIRCYASQFDGATQAGEVYPTGDSLYDRVRQQMAYYGSLIRCRYGEPYFTFETMRADDLAALEVATF